MRKETTIKIGKIILKTIAVAGVLSMAVLAPNALQSLKMLYGEKERKYRVGLYVKKTITKLNEKGFIEFQKRNNQIFVNLTKEGKEELLKYQLKEAAIKKPRNWDEKWRVIIFDIKEQRKNTRDNLRRELMNLGFLKLQNSVWVHPYDCEEVVILLKSYFHLGKDVLYMTVEKIENDKWLRKEFKLV